MPLDDIRRQLYKPGAEFGNRPTVPATFQPGERKSIFESSQKPEGGEKKKWYSGIRDFFRPPLSAKHFWIGGILLFIIMAGLIVFVYWYAQSSFDRSWVALDISGPDGVASGEEVIYRVDCKNSTKVDLNDAQLVFNWPADSIPDSGQLIEQISIGTLAAGQEKEIEFRGKIIGPKNSQKQLSAKLSYQPAKTSARFENVSTFASRIISVPLVLTFDMPQRVAGGQQITVSLKYLNDSESSFDNLFVKVEYPDGFKVSSSYPQPQENVWEIGRLGSKQEGKILITGTIEGERGDTKLFHGYLGVMKDKEFTAYADAVKSAQISLPVLSLEQTVNGASEYIANPNEELKYTIKYQNNSTLSIPSVKIVLKFNTQALDFTTLQLGDKGSFESVGNGITWDQTNTPELAAVGAGYHGELKFSVKVKDAMPVKTYSDKNFVIYDVVNSSSVNIPLALIDQQVQDTGELSIKINSKSGLDAKGYYQDTFLPNDGPVPPKVGQTTTYTIYWYVTNPSNDVKDVRVEAILPSYVEWLNKFKPASTNFQYDNLNRRVVWDIGTLPAATGVLSPAKYVAFQIGLTPSAPQINQVVNLINQSVITGKDSFTGVDLRTTDAQISSDLPDDPTITWDKGRVIQ